MKYYPIDENLARRAKEMNSFFNYEEGSATAAYRQEVDKAVHLAEAQKRKVAPIHHERIDRLLDAYARRLAENTNRSNAIACRVPSILVAGGSNFPVRKKEKQKAVLPKCFPFFVCPCGGFGYTRLAIGGSRQPDPDICPAA